MPSVQAVTKATPLGSQAMRAWRGDRDTLRVLALIAEASEVKVDDVAKVLHALHEAVAVCLIHGNHARVPALGEWRLTKQIDSLLRQEDGELPDEPCVRFTPASSISRKLHGWQKFRIFNPFTGRPIPVVQRAKWEQYD